MKKNLFILRKEGRPLLIFEKGRIKYFEEDNQGKLEEYLKDKIVYNHLKFISEKEVMYNNEEYKVIVLDIYEFKEIIDANSIKLFNSIDHKDIEYIDFKLIELFCYYDCRVSNLKAVELNNKEKESTFKSTIMAAAIGLIVIMLFIGKDGVNYFGISVPITITLTAIAGVISIGKVKKINHMGVYFLIVAILLSVTYGIFTNEVFRTLNLLLIPAALVTGLYMINFPFTKLSPSELLFNIIPNTTYGIFENSHLDNIKKAFKVKREFKIKDSKYKGIIKGVIISIPLLIFLTILLSSADMMFSNIFGDIIKNIVNTIFVLSPKSLAMKLFTFILVFIYVYYLFSSFKFVIKKSYAKKIKKLDKSMVNTILFLVNVLYLVFTFVQVKYLYIRQGGLNLSPEEYSSYARSGFFQLIGVVVLNIIIIIYFKSMIDDNKVTTYLNTLMTLISGSMAVTSMYKMSLYIREFGMTRLRFLTSIFMVFILIMLILIALSLWMKLDLFKYCILIGSVIYLGLNFCNMDKLIAQYNLNTVGINADMYYLSTLSYDSYDVVLKAYEKGRIDEIQFSVYKTHKKITKGWQEYNYYNNK